MANDVPALLQLVESLGKIYAATRSHASNSHARKELRSAVSKLSMALETPEDIIERTTYMVNRFCFSVHTMRRRATDTILNSH